MSVWRRQPRNSQQQAGIDARRAASSSACKGDKKGPGGDRSGPRADVTGGGAGAEKKKKKKKKRPAILDFSSLPDKIHYPSAFLLLKDFTCPSKHESSRRFIKAEEGNSSGNAHGGSVLKLIEEAGIIASMRHCNSQNRERCFPALAQMEKVDFLSPLSIGEIIHTTAEITYASKHSLEVQVQVVAENPITGAKRMANKASLWYVPCSLQNLGKVMEVPPIEYVAEQEAEGRRRYEAQKMKRLEAKPRIEKTVPAPFNPEPYTVGFSQSLLIQHLCYPECIAHGYMDSGVMMRAMDEVAGLVLYNHCLKKGNPVTISVRDFNFNQKLKRGSILTVMGRATFTSARSMEIEVIADSMPLSDGITYRCASAFFSYVIWDNGSVPLPPLKIEGEDEQRRFEEGKAHYLQQKAMRSAEK